MELYDIKTSQTYDNIAAIRFHQSGFNIIGVLEAQGNNIPEDGFYTIPHLNNVSIRLVNSDKILQDMGISHQKDGFRAFEVHEPSPSCST